MVRPGGRDRVRSRDDRETPAGDGGPGGGTPSLNVTGLWFAAFHDRRRESGSAAGTWGLKGVTDPSHTVGRSQAQPVSCSSTSRGTGSGFKWGATPLGDSGSRSDRRRWWLGDGPAGVERVGRFRVLGFSRSLRLGWVTNDRIRTLASSTSGDRCLPAFRICPCDPPPASGRRVTCGKGGQSRRCLDGRTNPDSSGGSG